MNKETTPHRIPAPTIIFDGKASLRRRTKTSRIVWLSISAAAVLAITLTIFVPQSTTLPPTNISQQIASQKPTKASPIDSDSIAIMVEESQKSQNSTFIPPTPTIKKQTLTPKPPPETDQKQTHIDQIRRRELPAEIPVQLNSCMAQVEKPTTIKKIETHPIVQHKTEPVVIIIANSNLQKFIEDIKPTKSNLENLLPNFEKKNTPKDYQIIPIFSKK